MKHKYYYTKFIQWKKIVLWLVENRNTDVTKASISNYSATLTQNSTTLSGVKNKFKITTEDGMFCNLCIRKSFTTLTPSNITEYCFKKN